MLRIDVLTIFPGIFAGPLEHGVLGRAAQAGRVVVAVHDLREFAPGKHRVTDEPPFGGGGGMVMKPEPIFLGVEALRERHGPGKAVLLSPQGERLGPALARRLSLEPHLILVCGRYEGVDQRVADRLADHEVSIGDYVLTGGELPALVLIDAVSRFVPGVVGDPSAPYRDSFEEGVLEGPQYTRPREFRGMEVPEVLLSGNHAAVAAWRKDEALRRTARRRPDLMAGDGTPPGARETRAQEKVDSEGETK